MLEQQYQLIYHRGKHDKTRGIPENSIPAFKRAIADGRGFELDVHITADDQIIVFHDSDLQRMTGATGEVEDLRLEELKDLRLLDTDCHIPTLEEVLELNNGQVPMILEIKNYRKENIGRLERILMQMLKKYPGELMIESFNPAVLVWLRKNGCPYKLGQLASPQEDWRKNLYYKTLLFNPQVKPDFIAYYIGAIDHKLVTACRKRKVPLVAWTIRNEAQLDKARSLCDGIIFEGIEVESWEV